MCTRLLTILCALLIAGSVAPAQTSISGFVKDENGRPVAAAEVSLIGTKYRALTDAEGGFRLDSLPSGRYWLGSRRLGYSPVAHSITLAKGKNRRFAIEMEQLPVTLSPVEVRAKSGLTGRRSQEFETRRRTAWGNFITRDDIDRIRPGRLGWMVQSYLPGLPSDAMDRSAWEMDTERFMYGSSASMYGARCSPLVSVNGATPSPGWAVNDFNPDEVEAVEVYRGRSTRLPVEFSMTRGSSCGVVVVWLR